MTKTDKPVLVRVTHRFDAAAERVYDAFLDPAKAAVFLFTTPTGEIVRCDIDARVGGKFEIVDRRDGEDVLHTGEYLELDRPRRLVFTFAVPKYSPLADRVIIEITPLPHGCELVLTNELAPENAAWAKATEQGWADILRVAAELLVDEAPTCGIGVAQHAAIPARLATMFEALAETLELHRRMLVPGDANASREDEVYRDLAERWREIAKRVAEAAATMAAQRELPMGAHDESAWGDDHVRAFETYVKAQTNVLALLQVAAPRDEEMLASMKPDASSS
jgi:uncharacterized protein YndB with AHSA1/START domain